MRLLVVTLSGYVGYADKRQGAIGESVGRDGERIGARQGERLMAERHQRQRQGADKAHENLPD